MDVGVVVCVDVAVVEIGVGSVAEVGIHQVEVGTALVVAVEALTMIPVRAGSVRGAISKTLRIGILVTPAKQPSQRTSKRHDQRSQV